jgi:hypothetical protein
MSIGAIVATSAPARAATQSSKVAYVNDIGSGSDDPTFPHGSSIFVNALTGVAVPNGGTYTTGDTTLTVTVTNVSVATIDALGVSALGGFDTVIMYQICDIGSHPATMAAINAYLTAGSGKVMIFDADHCFDSAPSPADYSTFLFPFTSSTPGPQGAIGNYTNVQASTLTTGLAVGPVPGDAVGDANNFVTFNPNWCGSITADNFLGHIGFVEAYARTPNGGLVIYQGEDYWFTFGPTAHLRTVFDLMLEQQFNPDGLPCALPASGISLAPPTQTHATGVNATVTATVVDANDVPQVGVPVQFTVTSGPNVGLVGGPVNTDGSGHASFSFTSLSFGTDVLHASFVDILGHTRDSNNVNAIFNSPPTAICQNVTVPTNAACAAVPASVDNGSHDADGDTVTLAQTPPGPYSLGSTLVTLKVTDSFGLSASCTGTVTVVDVIAPTVSCVQSVNPSGNNIPAASKTNEDGFYLVSASDSCGATTLTLGGIALVSGETIKLTQSPGQSGVTLVNTMGPLAIKHFIVGPDDPMIVATDGSGNVSTAVCLVPPPPK